MRETSKPVREIERTRKNRQEKKYLGRLMAGKLKDPPPSFRAKTSAVLGVDISSGDDKNNQA